MKLRKDHGPWERVQSKGYSDKRGPVHQLFPLHITTCTERNVPFVIILISVYKTHARLALSAVVAGIRVRKIM